ncbi:hypothetical protein R1flu_024245 [Riccia fluitans]|uniref:Plant heme peroxidase family profile domain-containing protein n=1 Tax=Riccia fluitans TaxID=41844 RepID=A0ABD1XYF9_9MARC
MWGNLYHCNDNLEQLAAQRYGPFYTCAPRPWSVSSEIKPEEQQNHQIEKGKEMALRRPQGTGCDGSILLESSHYSPAEKESRVPDSPKEIAYDIIDEIKGAIEKVCPVTVSCADILTLTVRDVFVELGGPGWGMCSSPLDGFISYANEVKFYMPGPRADYRTFVKKFAVKGLTEMDMVVLSDMPHSQTDSIHAFGRFFENKVVCCST